MHAWGFRKTGEPLHLAFGPQKGKAGVPSTHLSAFANLLVCMFKILLLKVGVARVLGVLGNVF